MNTQLSGNFLHNLGKKNVFVKYLGGAHTLAEWQMPETNRWCWISPASKKGWSTAAGEREGPEDFARSITSPTSPGAPEAPCAGRPRTPPPPGLGLVTFAARALRREVPHVCWAGSRNKERKRGKKRLSSLTFISFPSKTLLSGPEGDEQSPQPTHTAAARRNGVEMQHGSK